MATVVDVAQRAGVSPATVSRVLNGAAPVSSDARERVLEAVRALDYRPNPVARSLRLGQRTTVALLVGDIAQAHFGGLTKHLQETLEDAGYDLLIYNLGHSAERLRGFLQRALEMRLRCIVLASSDTVPPGLRAPLKALEESGCFVVSVGQNLNGIGLPSVVHEERAATARSVRQLVSRGRRRIAYAGRVTGSAIGTERFRGYKAALADAKLTFSPELLLEVSFRYAAGGEAVFRALDRGLHLDALQAGSDEIAMGAIAALQDRGLRVPQDVAVVGFGNVDFAAHVRPALSTLSSHPDLAASHVREMLRCVERGAAPARLNVVSRTLIGRESG